MIDQSDLAEAVKSVLRDDPTYKVQTTEIQGVSYRAFDTHFRSLRDLFEHGARFGSRTFLVYGNERISFADVWSQAKHLAAALQIEYGLNSGFRVAIAMRNRPEWIISFMAVTSIGGVVVPLNTWGTADDLSFALKDSEAQLLVADTENTKKLDASGRSQLPIITVDAPSFKSSTNWSDLVERAEGAPVFPIINADDDFCIMYTSGSTGRPKGVIQTHRGPITSILSWGVLGSALRRLMPDVPIHGDDPAILMGVPLFHVAGLHSNFLNSLMIGRKLVMMKKWDPKLALELIEHERVTNFVGVPTMAKDLADLVEANGTAPRSLVDMNVGGAKQHSSQVIRVPQIFPNASASSGYAMTETNALGAVNFGGDYLENPESTGRPVPPVLELEVRDGSGAVLTTGEVGQICMKSPANFRAYLNRHGETSQTLQDGWVMTGDLGYLDEQGFLYIVDRIKDLIIRGGVNISTLEVEAALSKAFGVDDVAVFSIPHERLGETVGAAISTKQDRNDCLNAIQKSASDHLPKFKRPERIWVLNAPFPKTATEKTNKPALRSLCLDRPPDYMVD